MIVASSIPYEVWEKKCRLLSVVKRDPTLDADLLFKECHEQLEPGEYLYLGLSGGFIPPSFMPHISDAAILQCHYTSYLGGKYAHCALYAVPRSIANPYAALISPPKE